MIDRNRSGFPHPSQLADTPFTVRMAPSIVLQGDDWVTERGAAPISNGLDASIALATKRVT